MERAAVKQFKIQKYRCKPIKNKVSFHFNNILSLINHQQEYVLKERGIHNVLPSQAMSSIAKIYIQSQRIEHSMQNCIIKPVLTCKMNGLRHPILVIRQYKIILLSCSQNESFLLIIFLQYIYSNSYPIHSIMSNIHQVTQYFLLIHKGNYYKFQKGNYLHNFHLRLSKVKCKARVKAQAWFLKLSCLLGLSFQNK